MPATQLWKAMIQAEHAQSDRMRGSVPPVDHWRPYARQFEADPRRTGDELVDRLASQVARHQTVIDVGAGGGPAGPAIGPALPAYYGGSTVRQHGLGVASAGQGARH